MLGLICLFGDLITWCVLFYLLVLLCLLDLLWFLGLCLDGFVMLLLVCV